MKTPFADVCTCVHFFKYIDLQCNQMQEECSLFSAAAVILLSVADLKEKSFKKNEINVSSWSHVIGEANNGKKPVDFCHSIIWESLCFKIPFRDVKKWIP